MTASGWLQLGIYVALLLAITKPLGLYLVRVLDPARAGGKTFLDPVLGPVERLIYRILRVDSDKRAQLETVRHRHAHLQRGHGGFHLRMLRLQDYLPMHQYVDAATSRNAMTEHLAFNTAMSFTTNTNCRVTPASPP